MTFNYHSDIHVAFTLFERDACIDSRLQGYRLKISGEISTKLQSTVTPEAWSIIKATCADVGLGETNVNATDARVTACRRDNQSISKNR